MPRNSLKKTRTEAQVVHSPSQESHMHISRNKKSTRIGQRNRSTIKKTNSKKDIKTSTAALKTRLKTQQSTPSICMTECLQVAAANHQANWTQKYKNS